MRRFSAGRLLQQGIPQQVVRSAAMPSRRHSDATLSSPRSPSITIRIFSSADGSQLHIYLTAPDGFTCSGDPALGTLSRRAEPRRNLLLRSGTLARAARPTAGRNESNAKIAAVSLFGAWGAPRC